MADIYFAYMFIYAVKKTDPKKLIALLIMIILNNISQCQTSPLNVVGALRACKYEMIRAQKRE